MLVNYFGYGYSLFVVVSLSYFFYIYVNLEEVVMDGKGWWIQEIEWLCISVGCGMMEMRIWSFEGKYVVSGY